MELDPSVEVDIHEMTQRSRYLMRADEFEIANTDLDLFRAELLPEWDEDWLDAERERVRQMRMHALERLCIALSIAGRHGEAIEAGLASIDAEPLRESAQRAVIKVHLAEGNRYEAIRLFKRYERLLADALGIAPSNELSALVGL